MESVSAAAVATAATAVPVVIDFLTKVSFPAIHRLPPFPSGCM
jgi:hypothetical protein